MAWPGQWDAGLVNLLSVRQPNESGHHLCWLTGRSIHICTRLTTYTRRRVLGFRPCVGSVGGKPPALKRLLRLAQQTAGAARSIFRAGVSSRAGISCWITAGLAAEAAEAQCEEAANGRQWRSSGADTCAAQRESQQPPLSRWLNHDGSDLRPPTHSTSLNATPSPLSSLCFCSLPFPTAHNYKEGKVETRDFKGGGHRHGASAASVSDRGRETQRTAGRTSGAEPLLNGAKRIHLSLPIEE